MRTIVKSQKEHWAIGRHVGCDQCDSVFEIEGMFDFRNGLTANYIIVVCPECGYGQSVYKRLSGPERMPTYTWSYSTGTLRRI